MYGKKSKESQTSVFNRLIYLDHMMMGSSDVPLELALE